MFEKNKSLFNSFLFLLNSILNNGIYDDVKLVIHAREKTMPKHVRNYYLPETSEVADLMVGQKHRKPGIVLRP